MFCFLVFCIIGVFCELDLDFIVRVKYRDENACLGGNVHKEHEIFFFAPNATGYVCNNVDGEMYRSIGSKTKLWVNCKKDCSSCEPKSDAPFGQCINYGGKLLGNIAYKKIGVGNNFNIPKGAVEGFYPNMTYWYADTLCFTVSGGFVKFYPKDCVQTDRKMCETGQDAKTTGWGCHCDYFGKTGECFSCNVENCVKCEKKIWSISTERTCLECEEGYWRNNQEGLLENSNQCELISSVTSDGQLTLAFSIILIAVLFLFVQ